MLSPFYLFGLLAVAAPIIVHLVRRTPTERRQVSSLLLHDASTRPTSQPRKLRDPLLFLLRAAAVALLVLAFTRPVWIAAASRLSQNSAGVRRAILLDVSAGMQVTDSLSSAIDAAQPYWTSSNAVDAVGLFTFDRDIKPLLPFDLWASTPPSGRAALAVSLTAEIQAGHDRTDLTTAVRSALQELLELEKPSTGPVEIVVVSDFAAGSVVSGLTEMAWPEGVAVELVPIERQSATNVFLQRTSRPEFDSRTSGPEIRIVRLADGDSSTTQPVNLRIAEAAKPESVVEVAAMELDSGRSERLVWGDAAAEFLAGGDVVRPLRVELVGDTHTFDNTIWLAPPNPALVRILYIGSEPSDDTTQARFYLESTLIDSRRQRYQLIASSDETADATSKFDLIVVADEPSTEELRRVRANLGKGGAVLCLLSSADDRTLETLLDRPDDDLVPDERTGEFLFADLNFQHPLLMPFAAAEFSDFSGIRVTGHRQLMMPEGIEYHVIARFDDGDPVIVEIPHNGGIIWCLTTTWRPVDSNWGRTSKFPALMHQFLRLAAERQASPEQLVVGDPLRLAEEQADLPAELLRPDGIREKLPPGETAYDRIDLPGIYEVRRGSAVWMFAANLDERESVLAPLSQARLDGFELPTRQSVLESQAAVAPATLKDERRAVETERTQQLWRWCLLGAALLLIAETWLSSPRRAAASSPTPREVGT